MRVCFLNHDISDKTGAGRFCLSLLGALKEVGAGNEYRVLTHDDELPTGIIKSVLALPRLRKIFKGFDIIHALDAWPYGFLALLGTRGLGIRVIITAIGTGAIQPLYSPIKGRLLRWAYRNADVVIAISHNTKREVLKKLPDLKIQVINHGVEVQKFQIPNPKSQINNKSQIPNYQPYILSVGTLKKRKGYDYSIKAFAEVASRLPDLKYVIVGTGPEERNLKSEIKNLKLEDRVIFLSGLDERELIGLFQNAELFILLSQDDNHDIEGFGLVFLEAAAAGLPVIATKGSSAEDAVLDGENGFLVPLKNSQKAAEAMVSILGDKNLRKSFSQAATDFARKMSWKKAAGDYVNIYKL